MKLAIFDYDGTIYPNETMTFLLAHWKKEKYSKVRLLKMYSELLPLYIKYKSGFIKTSSKEQIRELAVKGFNKIFYDMYEKDVNYFFKMAYQIMKESFNEQVISEIKIAKQDGYQTIIISGAHANLLNNISNDYEIDEVIGTEIYFRNGIYDHSKEAKIVTGSTKLDILRNHLKGKQIDWQESKAFADSYYDLPLLQAVGKPVAVNPDNLLKNVAIENGWKII